MSDPITRYELSMQIVRRTLMAASLVMGVVALLGALGEELDRASSLPFDHDKSGLQVPLPQSPVPFEREAA